MLVLLDVGFTDLRGTDRESLGHFAMPPLSLCGDGASSGSNGGCQQRLETRATIVDGE